MGLPASVFEAPKEYSTVSVAEEEKKPDEITRLTAVPKATEACAAGFSLMTFPDVTVPLGCIVTAPTVRFALVIVVVAVAWAWPTTLGTLIAAGIETALIPPEPLPPQPELNIATQSVASQAP